MELVLVGIGSFVLGGWVSYAIQRWRSRPLQLPAPRPTVPPSHPGPVLRKPKGE